MVYLTALLFALSVGLVIVAVAQLLPARSAGIARRLAELEQVGASPFGVTQRRDRQARRERWEGVLKDLGERVASKESDVSETRRRMVQAGFQNPTAPAVFSGVRIVMPLLLGGLGFLGFSVSGVNPLVPAMFGAAFGWVAPSFWLDRRINRRKKEIQLALADALDLMVTCVEAGLGINQAIMRVAEEIRHISTELSKELAMVNFEIRAGRPREEALRNLGDRTGVDDLRELTSMLIQTDRFGTSVAQALRVHSDTLRTKRRQRAEEAAAKTTIKILFPVLFCIFPGLFVVIIGPGAINIYETLIKGGGLGG
jgi:tight adherence protein C